MLHYISSRGMILPEDLVPTYWSALFVLDVNKINGIELSGTLASGKAYPPTGSSQSCNH